MNGDEKGAGDPHGRRLARREAAQADEASKIADLLALHLKRSGLPADAVVEMAKELRIRAVQAVERAEGHIEPRLTTKKTGHPLLEARSMNHLFLDESGSHHYNSKDGVFALGGISIHDADVKAYVRRSNALKKRFFGTAGITLHEPHMRKREGPFSFGKDEKRRAAFDKALRKLLIDTPFTVFGVAIRKKAFKAEFVDNATDPYLPTNIYDLAIMLVSERFVDYLSTQNNPSRLLGRVHLESIGPQEDATHQVSYANLLLYGTQYVPEGLFQSWVETACHFSPKTGSSPAELADIVARELFEWTTSDCKSPPRFWDIICQKIYVRGSGQFGKFGVKVFPDGDIKDLITEHRTFCGAATTN